MTALTDEELRKRIALAKEATPGPWYRDEILLAVIETMHEELLAAREDIARSHERALRDAVTIVQSRLETLRIFPLRQGVAEALEEAIIFLQAEAERASRGESIPGRPGSKSQLDSL
jgi:hypothetical protein